MTGWQETTLGEIADINPTAISTSGGDKLIRYIDISSVDIGSLNAPPAQMFLKDAPSRARRLVQYGDSVLSTVRPNRKSRFFVRHDLADAVVSTGFAVLRPKDGKTDARYLYSIICDENFVSHLVANEKGAAYPAVTTDIIERYPLVLPPLPEQRAIAAVLGALDDKIELNRRMNATLEAMARALFKNWFVDFDPVRAKMEGKQPFGMDTATAALFPSHLTADGLPEGWQPIKFSSLFETIGGGTPKTSNLEYWGGDIPWFSVVDAPSDSDVFVIDTEKSITQKGVDESSTKILPEGTTIISARGTVGRLALVGRPMAMNQSCYGLTPTNSTTPAFLYFSARIAVSELQARAHGSVFDTITRETLDSISAIKPDIATMQAYENLSGAMLNKIKGNLFEIENLVKRRDYLLPKLISGDIRIPDAEKFVEAA